MKKLLFSLAALLALLVVATPAFAATKPKPIPVMKPVPDTIQSVSESSISVKHIKMERKPDKSISETPIIYTYTITKFTSIQVNGQSAPVAALKAGMNVSVSANGEPGKTPPPEATSIVASDHK